MSAIYGAHNKANAEQKANAKYPDMRVRYINQTALGGPKYL
jgi:hypothetical protein